MSDRPGKNSMGYYCPECEKARQKNTTWGMPERRPALYERSIKGFTYAGYVNCPIHGVQPGQPMHGTRTLLNISAAPRAPGPAATAHTAGSSHQDVKTMIPAAGQPPATATAAAAHPIDSAQDEPPKDLGEYIEWREKKLNALSKKCDDILDDIKKKVEAEAPGPSRTAPGTKTKPSAQVLDHVTRKEQRKSLARRAALQHKLAKAAAGRIYHIAMKDGQEFVKGSSTGAIYKYLVVARQPGQNWKSYAWTQTSEGAEEEYEKMLERSDKQKLDLEILILDVVNEKEA